MIKTNVRALQNTHYVSGQIQHNCILKELIYASGRNEWRVRKFNSGKSHIPSYLHLFSSINYLNGQIYL